MPEGNGRFNDRGGSAGLGPRCRHYQHARKLMQHGDLEGARDTALLSVDADMNNPDAWSLLSEVYQDMGEPWHAQEAARQAVRSAPKRCDLRLLLGNRLLDANEPAGALEQFDTALGIGENVAAAQFNRAVALSLLGKLQQATEAVAQALESEPGLYDAICEDERLHVLMREPGFPSPPDGWVPPSE